MVCQDNFNQEYGQYILNITHIQSEDLVSIQNQHQFVDHFTNIIWIIHTREVFSVLIYRLSQKFRNSSKIFDPVINGFSPNNKSSHLNICDHSIITFVIRENFKGFSDTSCVDSFDRFRRSIFDKAKPDICILQKGYDSKYNNMKIQYANNFVHKLGMGNPTTYVYQFIYNEKNNNDTQITQYFVLHGFRLCIKIDSYVAHMFYAFLFSHIKAVPISKIKYFPRI